MHGVGLDHRWVPHCRGGESTIKGERGGSRLVQLGREGPELGQSWGQSWAKVGARVGPELGPEMGQNWARVGARVGVGVGPELGQSWG